MARFSSIGSTASLGMVPGRRLVQLPIPILKDLARDVVLTPPTGYTIDEENTLFGVPSIRLAPSAVDWNITSTDYAFSGDAMFFEVWFKPLNLPAGVTAIAGAVGTTFGAPGVSVVVGSNAPLSGDVGVQYGHTQGSASILASDQNGTGLGPDAVINEWNHVAIGLTPAVGGTQGISVWVNGQRTYNGETGADFGGTLSGFPGNIRLGYLFGMDHTVCIGAVRSSYGAYRYSLGDTTISVPTQLWTVDQYTRALITTALVPA
jgi:hypothetical protein